MTRGKIKLRLVTRHTAWTRAIAAAPALAYHPAENQRCPSCSGRHWLVGRMMAECAFCGTALPVAEGMPK
jgi:hypothetical protein